MGDILPASPPSPLHPMSRIPSSPPAVQAIISDPPVPLLHALCSPPGSKGSPPGPSLVPHCLLPPRQALAPPPRTLLSPPGSRESPPGPTGSLAAAQGKGPRGARAVRHLRAPGMRASSPCSLKRWLQGEGSRQPPTSLDPPLLVPEGPQRLPLAGSDHIVADLTQSPPTHTLSQPPVTPSPSAT